MVQVAVIVLEEPLSLKGWSTVKVVLVEPHLPQDQATALAKPASIGVREHVSLVLVVKQVQQELFNVCSVQQIQHQ